MEDSGDEVLLNSLRSAGVSVPANISNVRDLPPSVFVSLCAQCLNLIDETAELPTSLPNSTVDKFKICTDVALAVKRLGYIGDMSYYKLLYPSEEDLYKLLRFLLERLARSSDVVREDVNPGRKLKGRHPLGNETENADYETSSPTYHDGDLKGSDIHSRTKGSTSSHANDVSYGNQMDLASEAVESLSMEESEEVPLGDEDNNAEVDKISKMRNDLEKLQKHEKDLTEEVMANTAATRCIEQEFELLKAAAEMGLDDLHPVEFYIDQLNEQIEASKKNVLDLDSQRNNYRQPLEEKKKSIEDSLYSEIPEAQGKLHKLRELDLERESVLSEIRRREKEHSKLCRDLEKQGRQPSRLSYIERVKEITKNSRKQDGDIERILKETRELQLESNSIQERLHRTYAVLDEVVFREAKKDPVGRQAYRLLTSIHECFEQISEKILTSDRVGREVAEHEKKLEALTSSRGLNIEKLQADLDAIRQENQLLAQQHLQDN